MEFIISNSVDSVENVNFFNELALDSQSMAWRIIRLTTTQKVYWVGTMKTHVSVKIIFRKWWPITNKWRTMTKISQLLVLDRKLYRRRGQRWGWQGAQGRRWWESEQCPIFLRSLPHSLPPSKHLLLLLRQPAQKSKLTRVQGYLLKPGYQVTATYFLDFPPNFLAWKDDTDNLSALSLEGNGPRRVWEKKREDDLTKGHSPEEKKTVKKGEIVH